MNKDSLSSLLFCARQWVRDKLEEADGDIAECPREELTELLDLFEEIKTKLPPSDPLSRAKDAFDDLLDISGPAKALAEVVGNGALAKLCKASEVIDTMLDMRPVAVAAAKEATTSKLF